MAKHLHFVLRLRPSLATPNILSCLFFVYRFVAACKSNISMFYPFPYPKYIWFRIVEAKLHTYISQVNVCRWHSTVYMGLPCAIVFACVRCLFICTQISWMVCRCLLYICLYALRVYCIGDDGGGGGCYRCYAVCSIFSSSLPIDRLLLVLSL